MSPVEFFRFGAAPERPIFSVGYLGGDEPAVLTAERGGMVNAWRLDDARRLIGPLAGPSDQIFPLQGARGARPAIVAQQNQGHTVMAWYLDGQPVHPPINVESELYASTLVPDSDDTTVFAGGTRGGTAVVHRWSLSDPSPRQRELPGLPRIGALSSAEIDGRLVILAAAGSHYRLLDPETLNVVGAEPTARHLNQTCSITHARLDGTPTVLTGSLDGCVRLWDPRTGNERAHYLKAHVGGVHSIVFSSLDGEEVMVTAGAYDTTVLVWSVPSLLRADPQPIHRVPTPEPVDDFTVVGDGVLLGRLGSNAVLFQLRQ